MKDAVVAWSTPRPEEDYRGLSKKERELLDPAIRHTAADQGEKVKFYSARDRQEVVVPWWVIEALIASRSS